MNPLNRFISTTLPLVPRPIVGRISRRYIAGSGLDQAVRCIAELNAAGFTATVDILGEHTRDLRQASAATDAYVTLLDRIAAEGLDSNISVKLSQLGLLIDSAACLEAMRRLCRQAAGHGNFIRIDMEDATVTDATLDLHRALRADHPAVGVVLQSCLRRSRADARRLAAERTNVRVVKGIYLEPYAIAYHDREIVRRSFVELVEILLEAGCYVGIATHDEIIVYECLALIDRLGLAPDRYEFQMLLGVRQDLRQVIRDAGHRLRVYVPFGDDWYAYSLRRLKENPEIAGHVLRNLFRA
ncbi:MAG: proline dehydrogenase family protein [Candidatus Eiseniibacteriota bacterium]|jgi:proline dehydrogenase